ncbi:uncharacterized protein LOC106130855 [Amyelois transitella]|uniref:uncharacterized protein LOC106130855 n=1 Tax=Amyelois transitella TaxID=680683 RepID=UPI00298FFB8B|nr:uncharacterized protein LOC106130855 [Amyelois transitella]
MAEEYYLKPPRDQLFYIFVIFIMTIFGLADNKWWEINFSPKLQSILYTHATLVKLLAPTVLFMLTISFFDYEKLNFETLGIMFSVLPVSLIISARFKSYEKLMRDFNDKIHLRSYYMKKKDDFVKLNIIKIEKYTRRTFYFLGVFLMTDWCSWVIIPILNNIQNSELIANKTTRLQTCLYLWMPFDYSYNYNRWILMHILSAYLTFGGCSLITVFDTINLAFVFNLIAHIKILKYTIKNRFLDKTMTNEAHYKELVEVIKTHTFIVKTFDELQSAYGINVAGNYLQNLLEDSLLLYQLMFAEKGFKITYGIMLIVYMGELVLMSFVLEEVRRQSDDLPQVLYSIPWEDMSVSNQKIFKLVLLRFQPILSFKAACGLKAGVKPMMSILKSTFSYYIMLKSSVETK